MEIELYHCGCKVRNYHVEFGESKNDLTERPNLISDYSPVPSTGMLEEFHLKRLAY